MEGEIIGNYRVIRPIGEGGMGVVYLAQHQVIGRLAAIKLLHAQLSANREMVERFFNEARAAAHIHHPGLVDVYDYGRLPSGRAYIVMEYLEGESLAQMLDRERVLPPDLAVSLGRQIAAAVGAAHQKGIVHRDLKPDNVFIVRDDEVAAGLRARVLDFGVAKLGTGLYEQGGLRTRTGAILGTPLYMSPEQCRGKGTVGPSSDIYSLGCIMYEMVTGRKLFYSEGMGEIIAAHLHDTPEPPSKVEPSVPAWLDAVILRALAKKPEQRPATMDDLASSLGARPRTPTGAPPPPGVPARGPMTTHRRSAGELVNPPRSRIGTVAISASALALAGALTALALRTDRQAQPAPPPPPAAAVVPPPAAAPAPVPVPVPLPVPVVAPALPPASQPVAEADHVIVIKSQPAGADVVLVETDEHLGQTPVERHVKPGSPPLTFELRLAGYRPQRIWVRGDRDHTADVKLSKLAGRPTRPAPAHRETLDPFEEGPR